MSTTIKLDRAAFLAWEETLSEDMKITLSNTIIQEFSKKHIKGDFSKLISSLNISEKDLTEEFKEKLQEHFDKTYSFMSRKLEEEFRQLMIKKQEELVSKTDLFIRETEANLERNIKKHFEEMFKKYSPERL